MMKATGAYFIQRDSRDPLYRRVLEHYMHMAIGACVPQGLFIEGALSRDGRLQRPKLGMLDYMTGRSIPAASTTSSFCRWRPTTTASPKIAISSPIPNRRRCPRRLPSCSAARCDSRLEPRFGAFSATSTSLLRVRQFRRADFAQAMAGPEQRRSAASQKGDRFKWVEKLANEVMGEISTIVPVVPIPLVAAVMMESRDETMSGPDIIAVRSTWPRRCARSVLTSIFRAATNGRPSARPSIC